MRGGQNVSEERYDWQSLVQTRNGGRDRTGELKIEDEEEEQNRKRFEFRKIDQAETCCRRELSPWKF